MTKQDVKAEIINFFRTNNLQYKCLDDNGEVPASGPMPLKELNILYIAYNADMPGNIIESDFHLFENRMLARAFYPVEVAEMCKNADKKRVSSLLRVINFVNETLLSGFDIPYNPRMYVSTDGCGDIAIKTMIDYRIFELLPQQETLNYLTIFYPQVMEELSYPIIGVIAGKLTAAVAINYIKKL